MQTVVDTVIYWFGKTPAPQGLGPPTTYLLGLSSPRMAKHDDTMLVRLPRQLKNAVTRVARKNRRPRSEQVRIALEENTVKEDGMAKVETPQEQKRNVRAGKHREDNLRMKDEFRRNAKPAREGMPAESDKKDALSSKKEFRAKQNSKTLKLKDSFRDGQDARVGF